MRFARIVFTVAGVYGLLCITPLYLTEQLISEQSKVSINHPEFYYGFVGVTLSWQVAFLIIAKNPYKYRLFMWPACLEKLSFCTAIPLLYYLGRISEMMLFGAAIDFVLLVLFILSIFMTGQSDSSLADKT